MAQFQAARANGPRRLYSEGAVDGARVANNLIYLTNIKPFSIPPTCCYTSGGVGSLADVVEEARADPEL